MAANNEVGTLNPIAEIGRLCHERGVVFHTDAAQAVGKVPLDVDRRVRSTCSAFLDIKSMPPRGSVLCTSAVAIRQVRLLPLLRRRRPRARVPQRHGAGSARSWAWAGARLISHWPSRPAEAAPAARAARAASRGDRGAGAGDSPERSSRRSAAGKPQSQLRGVDGEALMMAMRDVAVSSGSACSSANPEPSHVLLAMGLSEDLARASLRFGLGRFTTAEEIDFAVDAVSQTPSSDCAGSRVLPGRARDGA